MAERSPFKLLGDNAMRQHSFALDWPAPSSSDCELASSGPQRPSKTGLIARRENNARASVVIGV